MTSRLIYGCMGLGGQWGSSHYTEDDAARAAEAVEAALAIGITRFDHADIYRGGYYDLSSDAIRTRVEASLRRLRTDRLDQLLLHRPDPLADPAEVGGAVVRLLDEGLIRAVGVSNFSAAQMAALQDHLPVPLAANQLELSLARHDFVDSGILVNHPEGAAVSFPRGTLEHCARTGAEVQAWSPLAGGRFTGHTTARGGSAGDPTAADLAASELVAELAGERGTTGEAIVLGWLMRHPAGIAPVVGSATPARIRACAGAEEVAASMTRPEWYALYIAARGRAVP